MPHHLDFAPWLKAAFGDKQASLLVSVLSTTTIIVAGLGAGGSICQAKPRSWKVTLEPAQASDIAVAWSPLGISMMLPFLQLCGVVPVLLALSLPVVNGELRGLGSPLAKAKGAPHNETIKLAAPVPQPSQPGPNSTTFAQPEWSSAKDTDGSSGATPVVPATESAKASARRLQDDTPASNTPASNPASNLIPNSKSSPDYQETRIAARGELGKELGAASATLIAAAIQGQVDVQVWAQVGAHFLMGGGLLAATLDGGKWSPLAMFGVSLIGALFPDLFPQESLSEKLENLRQRVMDDVNVLVDSSLFQQEFEQSSMHIKYFFREMEWAHSSMHGFDPQARVAYVLSLEQRAESLRNSLFRTCMTAWHSTECQNTIMSGGLTLLQGLMLFHFSLMRTATVSLAYTIANEDQDWLMIETFNFVGCPNGKPSLDGWKDLDSAMVLEDMYDTCRLNLDGTASQEQQEQG